MDDSLPAARDARRIAMDATKCLGATALADCLFGCEPYQARPLAPETVADAGQQQA